MKHPIGKVVGGYLLSIVTMGGLYFVVVSALLGLSWWSWPRLAGFAVGVLALSALNVWVALNYDDKVKPWLEQ